MAKTPLFHRGHYNIIAKQFKNEFEASFVRGHMGEVDVKAEETVARVRLYSLMLSLTRRLKEDNEAFDPLLFLDACSPDPETYPFSEFWEDNSDSTK